VASGKNRDAATGRMTPGTGATLYLVQIYPPLYLKGAGSAIARTA